MGAVGNIAGSLGKIILEDQDEDDENEDALLKNEDDYDDPVYYNNPIMRGLIPFRSFIE